MRFKVPDKVVKQRLECMVISLTVIAHLPSKLIRPCRMSQPNLPTIATLTQLARRSLPQALEGVNRGPSSRCLAVWAAKSKRLKKMSRSKLS